MEIVRPLEWRDKPQPIKWASQRYAAQAQRCGMEAPAEPCTLCATGQGVFTSCVVAVVAGSLLRHGACMSCSFKNNPRRCSFGKGSIRIEDVAL